MNTCSPGPAPRRRSDSSSRNGRFYAALVISALGSMLLPMTAGAHPHTRQGFFMGFGVGVGWAGQTTSFNSADGRKDGASGSFRLAYAFNPKFALGMENNSWLNTSGGGSATLGTITAAVSYFPALGLVLRAGAGAAYAGSASDGVSGDGGSGLTLGAAYEFRVARSFALGPQLDYSHVKLSKFDSDYLNLGLSMNWYFIPR
jgi:hypothetical protein